MVRHESHMYKNCWKKLLNLTNDFKILMTSVLSIEKKFKTIENINKKHESTDQ